MFPLGTVRCSTLLACNINMQLKLARAGPHTGYVIDGALDEPYLASLDAVRRSLPVDTEKKQTAAARRFFCAEEELQWIRDGLVRAIRDGLSPPSSSVHEAEPGDDAATHSNPEHSSASEIKNGDEVRAIRDSLSSSSSLAHEAEPGDDAATHSNPEHSSANEIKNLAHRDEFRVLPHARFLEYREPDGSLGPHTDALIRCKETGRWSTHTLLVFIADCDAGGETTLLPELPKAGRAREKRRRKARDAARQLEAAIARIGAGDGDGRPDDAGGGEGGGPRLARLRAALARAEGRVAREPALAASCCPVRPRRGRIFFFPHRCPHEGRPTVSVPKIFLRAELLWMRGDEAVDG